MAKREPLSEHQLLERLSIATQAAGIFVWEFDWATNSISWDENRLEEAASKRHYGYELGDDLFKWVHPDDRDIGHKAMSEALARGEADASFDYRLRLGDGSIRHIRAYARTSVDAQGKPARSVGVSWDITREVEAAEALHDAQRRLERASLSIHEGHWELDLITQKHWCSSSYRTLLGYDADELDVDTIDKVNGGIHPEDLAYARDVSERHIADGTPYAHELRLRLKDGSYRWFHVRGVAERDARGRAVRLSGSIQDVHKHRLIEDELKIARQRFERAIRGTQDGLWEWDITQQALWVSPRFEAILDYVEGEVSRTARTPNDLVHPDDLGICEDAQQCHFRGNGAYDVEVRMRTRGGAYRWVRMRGEADRNGAGIPMRLAGSIQDIAEARASRDALIRASDAAQAASRSKSAFLANVSHEIRTPMNGIVGMTSLLLNTGLDAAQRDCAETIRASADSLLAVINDILDFSKIEAGRLDIEALQMSLPQSMAEVRAILGFQAAAKGLQFEVMVRPGTPQRVIGDPQRIRQCLLNLISNAIKFTPSGAVVAEVSARAAEPGRSLVRFEVRDTGIGIAPEAVAKLFQPFVQADSSTTRHFGGTGLGLSIMRRLVEMMGGRFGVDSRLGKGSAFWFELPMPVVAAPEASPADSPAAADAGAPRAPAWQLTRGYRGSVLLVEDNPVNQKVARSFLERMGCEVHLTANGLEAIQVFAQRGFDLVLLDLQMPMMDGYSATSCMRKLEDGRRRTPIVALTASAMSGQRERCLEAGMDDLITKPLDIARLRATLERFGLRDGDDARSAATVARADAPVDDSAALDLISGPTDAAAVDLDALRLMTGADADFERELSQIFVHMSEEMLAKIGCAAGRGERAAIKLAAHSLKGASANIYAVRLKEMSADLEARAETLADCELMRNIACLAAERSRVVAALQSGLSRSSPSVAGAAGGVSRN